MHYLKKQEESVWIWIWCFLSCCAQGLLPLGLRKPQSCSAGDSNRVDFRLGLSLPLLSALEAFLRSTLTAICKFKGFIL